MSNITPTRTREWVEKAALNMLGQNMHEIIVQEGYRDVNSSVVNTNYLAALETVLIDVGWDFAKTVQTLVFFSDKFKGAAIPPDLLRIIAVGHCMDCNGHVMNGGWRTDRDDRGMRRIYPCCGDLIEYVYNNERLEYWTPKALDMLVLKLAELSAPQVTADRSNAIAPRFRESYMELKNDALRTNRLTVIR